ncbi:MAG: META domain-containing protein [Treponema sp.]|nr:META domain-containing protein [Treponema sp.]
MKKQLFMCLIAAALITACAATGDSTNKDGSQNSGSQDFSGVTGKEWKLLTVHINGTDTRFRRDTQPHQVSRDIFSLRFDTGIISGVGAPNRYSGRYTLTDQGLTVTPLASTMMASLFEPENLREHDFLLYMQNIKTWRLINNSSNLELTSMTSDGKQVKMVFGL